MTEHTDTPPVAGETTDAAIADVAEAIGTAFRVDVGVLNWTAEARAAIAAYRPHLTAERDAETKHTPIQIGTHDAEGYRTHTIPGDVCLGCSSPAEGRWVPVSQCPQALAALDAEEAEELPASPLGGRDAETDRAVATVRALMTALGLDPDTVTETDDAIRHAKWLHDEVVRLHARDVVWKAYADDLSALLDRRNWYAPPLPAVLADPAPSTPAAPTASN